ncbi:hypothetical protein M4914_21530 [Streptomyces somaliensis DSM 40738]|uniref:Uncharacterized protein n=1 Tax=Streptomyces somaliensis (strain ATCC 33201 / DSM 40738 / JCM 12659 / KCTC 9044 / NCTC 11332 / NRRL B-12077 / IP 733) TaxID=1134445 RepID=A0AA44DCB1_STRE0|nr:hypothetical protein [Streptomyces somaliensis]MCQ0025262.1 hypothetical protein [Streptomyces somaliensis DSM 40738]NKY13760.1 hypothetical protein [Streptomyces somaliensis DSM 40738]
MPVPSKVLPGPVGNSSFGSRADMPSGSALAGVPVCQVRAVASAGVRASGPSRTVRQTRS